MRRDVADLPTGEAESLSMAEFFWSFDEVVAPLSPVPLPYSAPPLGRGLRADGSHRPPSETRDRLTLSAHKKTARPPLGPCGFFLVIAYFAASEVQMFDVQGILLDELAAGFHNVAH